MSNHNNSRNSRNNHMEEVHIGKMKWYSRPRNSTAAFGYVISSIDRSETRVDASVLINCSSLREGSLIIYRKGRRGAKSVFDLSRMAEDDQINRYWEMLIKLARYKNDPIYPILIQIARKFFASMRDRVCFLLCILLNRDPFPFLPKNILADYSELFHMATNQQRCFLYENRPEIFSKYWKEWKKLHPFSADEVVPEFPIDFLLKFPDCFDDASDQQRLHLLKADEQTFAEELENSSEVLGSWMIRRLPRYYLEEYLRSMVMVPNPLLQFAAAAAGNSSIGRAEEKELTYLAAKDRGIKYLVHFTRIENLKGILRDGRLITRDRLENRDDNTAEFTDENRLDNVKDSISLSVSFPNSPMFYTKRKTPSYRHPRNTGWCVLLLKAELLKDFDCLFNRENAASNNCRYIPREERMSLKAFTDLFAEDGQRDKLITIDENPCGIYATHPQAEILCLDDIPASYIECCCFPSNSPDDVWGWRCKDIKQELDPMLEKYGIKSIFENKYFDYGPYRHYNNHAA